MPEVTLGPGTHVCHIYSGFHEQRDVVVEFFQDGLRLGEHCLYITSKQTPEEWHLLFEAHGIDVEQVLEKGLLSVIDGAVWRQVGDMNSIVKAREALGLIEGLLAKFPGVRIAGDAAWALNPVLAVDQLCHVEATLNLVYEGWNVRTICQYELEGHSPAAINAALRTHPYAILDGRLIQNNFYEAPEILANEPTLNDPTTTEQIVRGKLDRLRATAST